MTGALAVPSRWSQWDPFASDVHEDPYPHYQRLRDEAPCVLLEKYNVWYVSRFADVSRILHDWQTFSTTTSNTLVPTSNPIDGGIFMSTAPPEHDRLRGAIIDDFKPRKILEREPRVRQLAAELIEQTFELGAVDWAAHFCERLPTTVMAEMLGFPDRHRQDYCRWASAAIGATASPNPTASRDAYSGMYQFITEIYNRRELVPGGWGASVLELARNGAITQDEAIAMLGGILVGAMDTTVNLLGNLMNQLMEFAPAWAKLCGRPELAAGTVEESLRYDAPTQPGFFRSVEAEVDIADVRVPAGGRIMVGFGSANRDPREFPQADTFDIERRPNRHVSFGRGIHMCLGAPVARMIARVATEELAQRVAAIERAGAAQRKDSPAIRGFTCLPVRLTSA